MESREDIGGKCGGARVPLSRYEEDLRSMARLISDVGPPPPGSRRYPLQGASR